MNPNAIFSECDILEEEGTQISPPNNVEPCGQVTVAFTSGLPHRPSLVSNGNPAGHVGCGGSAGFDVEV